jgi:hypothetical protein
MDDRDVMAASNETRGDSKTISLQTARVEQVDNG